MSRYLSVGLLCTGLVFVQACGDGSNPDSSDADTAAPQVLFTLPAADASDVPLSASVSVAFNELVDPSTVNTASFTLEDDLGVPVSGAVVAGTTGGTFTPASALSLDTVYTATVTTAVTDQAGNPLATEVSWSFATSATSEVTVPDVTAPQVLFTSPAANAADVPKTTTLFVLFNEAIDASTLSPASLTLEDNLGRPVRGTVSAGGANGLVFTPGDPLRGVTTYTATVTTAVTDLAGNPLAAEVSWSFTTACRSWGTAQLLEADNAGHAWGPHVAVDSTGNAIAVWSQSDGTLKNVWANRYVVGSGWGTAELIETEDSHLSIYVDDFPQVAVDPAGNAVAVWGQSDGSVYDIWANRYVVGVGWGSATPIETNDIGDAWDPQVAVDSAGNAVVVWAQPQSSITDRVWTNRYMVGSGWGSATPMETVGGESESPQVAVDTAGNAIAVWQKNLSPYAIWFGGYAVGSGWGTAEALTTGTSYAFSPQIAVDSSGNAIAVWGQDDGVYSNIWASRYVVGSGWGTAELIETDDAGSAWMPQVAVDSAGNAIVVWLQSDGTRRNIWANRYEVGSGWGTATQIETDDAGDAWIPQVSVDSAGNAIVVWHQSDGTRDNIWANRFD